MLNKNIVGGDCHGVCISDSVVCCEARVASKAHLTDDICSSVDVSLPVFQQGCGRPRRRTGMS